MKWVFDLTVKLHQLQCYFSKFDLLFVTGSHGHSHGGHGHSHGGHGHSHGGHGHGHGHGHEDNHDHDTGIPHSVGYLAHERTRVVTPIGTPTLIYKGKPNIQNDGIIL